MKLLLVVSGDFYLFIYLLLKYMVIMWLLHSSFTVNNSAKKSAGAALEFLRGTDLQSSTRCTTFFCRIGRPWLWYSITLMKRFMQELWIIHYIMFSWKPSEWCSDVSNEMLLLNVLIIHIILILLHISFTFFLQKGFVQHKNKQHLKEVMTYPYYLWYESVW